MKRALTPSSFATKTLAGAMLLMTGLAGGCADEGPGSLIIPFTLGNDKDCGEVGVDRVRAWVDDDDPESVSCEDGEIRLDNLPAGGYELTVQGMSDDGAAIMDNLDNGDRSVTVLGDGAAVTLDSVRLTDAPAEIRVSWNFGTSNCANAGITDFDVSVFQVGGTAELAAESLDCDKAEADNNGYRLLPDPDRAINGNLAGEASISAEGTNALFYFEPPGPGRAVKLDLLCTNDGCECDGDHCDPPEDP